MFGELFLFGVEHQFFFVFALISEGVTELFLPAFFRPPVANLVAPGGWEQSEEALQDGVMEDSA